MQGPVVPHAQVALEPDDVNRNGQGVISARTLRLYFVLDKLRQKTAAMLTSSPAVLLSLHDSSPVPASGPSITFPPARFAALRRALSVRPATYATRRNYLDGSVTALSPYITHGLLPDGELYALWRERFGLTLDDPLLQQLAWRSFFHHVRRRRGEAILSDLHPPAHAPTAGYRPTLPADVLTARTGVRVIDASIRQLYSQGWLHNHQRLWLASYCVHLRKVHWRVGADWMYGHLLDGDVASNHLSWQWVAGTFSSKPYLFNAANVARYAPLLQSAGTVIDTDYEALARMAVHAPDIGPSPARDDGVTAPRLLSRPPQRPAAHDFARLTRGRRVALLHPWDLARRPDAECVLGVVVLPFHARFPWSTQRWQFVLERMRSLCDAIWIGRPENLALMLDGCLEARATLAPEPDYAMTFGALPLRLEAPAPFLPEPDEAMPSFSAWLRWMRRNHAEHFSTPHATHGRSQ